MPLASGLIGLTPALALSLVHFLWQGAAIAIALRLVLALSHSPRARYAWSLSALIAMAAAPAVTFWALTRGTTELTAVAIAPAVSPFAPGPSWLGMVVVAWAAGASILALRALVGFALVDRLRRRAEPLPRLWAQRCKLLAATVRVAFAQSRDISGPVVVGIIRPVVLVPAAALAMMPVEQLEALILHELAHVRRLDALANLFQTLVEILLFYHPATWWVSRTIRIEREHCCDDMAVGQIGDPTLFVRALESLVQLPPPPAMALGAGGAPLLQRVRRLLGIEDSTRKFDVRALAASLLVLTVLMLGWSAHSDARPAKPTATELAAEKPVASAGPATADAAAAQPEPDDNESRPRSPRFVAEPDQPAGSDGEVASSDPLERYYDALHRYQAILERYQNALAGTDARRSGEELTNQQLGDANRQLGAASQALASGSRQSGRQYRAGNSNIVSTTLTVGSASGTTTIDEGPTFSITGPTSNVLFQLDGRRSSEAVLRSIPPARIASIQVTDAGSGFARSQGAHPEQPVVNLVTKPPSSTDR